MSGFKGKTILGSRAGRGDPQGVLAVATPQRQVQTAMPHQIWGKRQRPHAEKMIKILIKVTKVYSLLCWVTKIKTTLMILETAIGKEQIFAATDLLHRLETKRTGEIGAFILYHDPTGPSLWLQLNKQAASLYFFPDPSGQHPGYQAQAITPADAAYPATSPQPVFSREAVSGQMQIPLQLAFQAAREFMAAPVLPPSINWQKM